MTFNSLSDRKPALKHARGCVWEGVLFQVLVRQWNMIQEVQLILDCTQVYTIMRQDFTALENNHGGKCVFH